MNEQAQEQNENQQNNLVQVYNNPFNLNPDNEDICINRKIDRDILLPFFGIVPNFGIENNYYSMRTVDPLKESFFHMIQSYIFPNATFYQISIIICYIIITVFIISASFGLDETNMRNLLPVRLSTLDKIGSFLPKKIKEKYWNFYRLLTFNFLHFTFRHLILNIVGLISLCSLFELLVKKHCFLLIFFLNGIFTNITGLLVYNMDERYCGINIGINGIIGSYFMLCFMNWDEIEIILGPAGNIAIIILALFYVIFVSLILNMKNILNSTIQFVSVIYGILLCAIIVKPIKKEKWKLYTRIGSGAILLFMTVLSLVLFILKK